MGASVKSGGFQLSADVGECATPVLAERHGTAADESIDVVHPKPDALHVKRPNCQKKRPALFKERVAWRALRLRLYF